MQVNEFGISYSITHVEGRPAIWISGATCRREEVAGEAYKPQQMAHVVSQLQGRLDTIVAAWLVREPLNPHDSSAVAIWVLGGQVGYLPRPLATVWSPLLKQLQLHNSGLAVACQATLDPPSVANQGGFGILLWLPPPIAAREALTPRPPFSQPRPFAQYVPPEPIPTPEPIRVAPTPPRPPPLPAAGRVQATEAVASPAPTPSAQEVSPEKVAALRAELSEVERALERARAELAYVEESLEIQSFGFYTPRYGFESSADYSARFEEVRESQKRMLNEDKAAPCDTTWTVGGSAAAGKKMVKQQVKLMLRAFNGECDAAIANVRYNNVIKLEQRMQKSFAEVNKLGEVQQVSIAQSYFDLRLAELHLVHEHREKVQEEKEEQKRIREQMREEQRAEEEIAKAKAAAEQEEQQSLAALAKARADLEASEENGRQHEKFAALVGQLESRLSEALDSKAKAIARAQLTRSGHVYVLSNIGSFGDNVYKIGMTRRLDPYERVDELGAASVPFPFDVHAIIFAEDAPGLETKLHRAFAGRRVNAVNHRKEYFRVTLKEIEEEVKKAHGLVTFELLARAEQFNKTRAMLDAGKTANDHLLPASTEEDSESGIIAVTEPSNVSITG